MSLPCYAKRLPINSWQWTKYNFNKMQKYVSRELKKWNNTYKKNTGVLVISITEEDSHHSDWLYILSTFPGAVCTSTVSKYDGTHTCWLICIPVNGEYV